MTSLVRGFLTIEALSFYAAALLHSGWFVPAHAHAKAATAEAVIGTVLLGGLVASLVAPNASRAAALLAQGFALIGTGVGIFTIAIGIGPRTPLDAALHAGFIALLATGLARVRRGHRPGVSHA